MALLDLFLVNAFPRSLSSSRSSRLLIGENMLVGFICKVAGGSNKVNWVIKQFNICVK